MPDTVITIHRHLYFRFGCSYDRKSRLFLCVEFLLEKSCNMFPTTTIAQVVKNPLISQAFKL